MSRGNDEKGKKMKYQVIAIIDGIETTVCCKNTDEFIDVCEALGTSVKRAFEYEQWATDRREIEIDWL